MGRWIRFKDFAFILFKDINFTFILLASTLVSLGIFYPSYLSALPYAFGWLVFAWAITDRSVLRRVRPYLVIFLAFYVQKIYWNVFNTLYSPSVFAISLGQKNYLSSEWLDLLESASWLFVFIEFSCMLVALTTIWYLARPRDFKVLKRKMIVIGVSAFLITTHTWLWILCEKIFLETQEWYRLLFFGIPISISMVLFGTVITSIERKLKICLYAIIGLSTLVPTFPTIPIFSQGISYFVVFLCFLLLAKTKYLEQ